MKIFSIVLVQILQTLNSEMVVRHFQQRIRTITHIHRQKVESPQQHRCLHKILVAILLLIVFKIMLGIRIADIIRIM